MGKAHIGRAERLCVGEVLREEGLKGSDEGYDPGKSPMTLQILP